MADRFTITITGFDNIGKRLGAAAAKLERPVELMQLIGATMEQNIALRFISKTDPAGAPWAPLAASTLAGKKGRGSLLELTGRGKGSLAYNLIGDDSVEVGFGEPYMGFHETGTKRMPRRGLLSADWQAGTLGAQDESDIRDDIATYLNSLGL